MKLIEEMKLYYSERAREYDEWYLRKNQYDKGVEKNKLWFSDLNVLKEYAQSIQGHKIIELAAGTGMWTQFLAENNDVMPVDNSQEMLDCNFDRTGIVGKQVDIFETSWHREFESDLCFFGFWLSHIPPERLQKFWSIVKQLLIRNGRIVVFDSYLNRTELNCLSHENNVQVRVLNDGRQFRVYKKYYTKHELEQIANELFSEYKLIFTENYFYILDGSLHSTSYTTDQ